MDPIEPRALSKSSQPESLEISEPESLRQCPETDSEYPLKTTDNNFPYTIPDITQEEIVTSKIITSNEAPATKSERPKSEPQKSELIKSEPTKSEIIKSEAAKATEVLKSILKRAHPQKKLDIAKASNSTHATADNNTSPKTKCCHPLVDKLKTMADKQYHKGKRNIKKYALRGDDPKIVLEEEQKILNLKESPRAERKVFASYVVKQDSDDVLDIVEMDESPSEVRKRRDEEHEERTSILVPDEVIDLPTKNGNDTDAISIEPTINELLEEEFKSNPPKKAPRKSKDHHYEDIDDGEHDPLIQDFIQHLSLHKEDENIVNELKNSSTLRPISSVDSTESTEDDEQKTTLQKSPGLLAPISSIDSASSDEDRRVHLASLSEESDQINVVVLDSSDMKRSNLKRETSPNAEKKVTFSPSTEDEPVDEPHREDVDLPSDQLKVVDSRWSKMRYV